MESTSHFVSPGVGVRNDRDSLSQFTALFLNLAFPAKAFTVRGLLFCSYDSSNSSVLRFLCRLPDVFHASRGGP